MEQAKAVDGLVGMILIGLQGGMPLLQEALRGLLRKLVAIELIVGAFAWAGSHLAIFGHAMTGVLKAAVFAFLLTSLPYVTNAFIDYCIFGGLTLSGAATKMSVEDFKRPSTVLIKGFEATKPIIDWSNKHVGMGMLFNAFTIATVAVAMLLIWGVFVAVAGHLVWVLLAAYIAAAFAVIGLPFGVLGPVSFIAQRGVAMTVENAMRLGLAALVTGFIFPFVESFFLQNGPTQNIDIAAAFWLVVGGFVSLLLTVGIPAIVKAVAAIPIGGWSGALLPGIGLLTGAASGGGGGGGGRPNSTGGASPPREPRVERTTSPGYEFY